MTFTYTKIVGSWADLVVVTHTEGFLDDRPVALCKGDDTAKATEQLQQQNMQQQMAASQQLMQLFQQQFGKQNAISDYLTSKMQPIVDAGGKGYSDDALAAMRTSATDNLSTSYQNAQRTLQAHEFTNGSRDLPSGVNDQLDAALLSQEASDKAGTQNNITLQNENLKQQNYWNALNVLNGQAAMDNPLGYAGAATNAGNGATSAGNGVANLSQAVTASNQSGLMGVLGGLAGGVFGAAGEAGGFGKLFCWIAAAHWNGMLDPRTIAFRNWFLTEFRSRWYGAPIVWLYGKTGRWVAEQKFLVNTLAPLLEAGLAQARA